MVIFQRQFLNVRVSTSFEITSYILQDDFLQNTNEKISEIILLFQRRSRIAFQSGPLCKLEQKLNHVLQSDM